MRASIAVLPQVWPGCPGCCLGLLCLLLLQACGGRQAHQPHEAGLPSWMGTVEDLRRFPQDLNGYAARAGKDKELFSAAEQSVQVARFMRIYFGPWEMTKTSVSRRDAAAIFHRARGFKYDDVRWTQEEWDAISRNAAMGAFPSRSTWAITVRATDLREMPTSQTRFAEPTPDPRANPFDYFQYSLCPWVRRCSLPIPPGTDAGILWSAPSPLVG